MIQRKNLYVRGMDGLNYHHLRYFWVAARERSLSRAAKRLRVTQPTVSEQVHALEAALGGPLFAREGRQLVTTDLGKTALRFADEIFGLGGELMAAVAGRGLGRPTRLVVGIADEVPKLVAYRILEPALAMSERFAVECHEDAPHRLLAALTENRLDVVIADSPVTPAPPADARLAPPRLYNHLLGECGVGVFGVARMARELAAGFPRSLDGAPFLLPTATTALRRELDAWFVAHHVAPRVVGEFQDAALLAVFAEAGAGVFAAPDAIAPEVGVARRLHRVGSLAPLRARYYAITSQRRVVHPALSEIAGAARERIFTRRRPIRAR